MKSEKLEELMKEIESHDNFNEIIKKIYSSNQYEIFESIMNDVNENFFIKDSIHGIQHNERVAILCMAIGINEKLSNSDIKILIKAAMYHDIGRTIAKGKEHGFASAKIIEENKSELAKDFNTEELELLKLLCCMHSNPDDELENLVKQYNISNIEKAQKLMSILKDADALDRIRLPKFGKLNPDFLRLEISNDLIPDSEALLNLYKDMSTENELIFDSKVFDFNNFNIIEDENNIYIFRALNYDNEIDLDDNNLNIIRSKSQVATDNGDDTNFSIDSKPSLEEVYSNVRVARTGKINNCISFSTNSNVTLDYANRRYVMYAIPKNGDENIFLAGKFMLEEIENRINKKLNSTQIDSSILDILTEIDNKNTTKEIKALVAESFELKPINKEKNRKYIGSKIEDVSEKSLLARFENKQLFNLEQEIEYNKIIAKLTVLEYHGILKSILQTQLTNSRLISAIGSAFSSGEAIYYGNIQKDNVIEISKEDIELFSLLQQLNEKKGIDKESLDLLKSEIFEKISAEKNFKINDEQEDIEFVNIPLEKAVQVFKSDSNSNEIIPYVKGNIALNYIQNYAFSKLKTNNLLEGFKNYIGNEEHRTQIEKLFESNKNDIIVPFQSIIGRRNNSGIKLSESVNLDMNPESDTTLFSKTEQNNLISKLNELSYEELVEVSKGNFESIYKKGILINSIEPKLYLDGNDDYFIDYIIDNLDLERIYKNSSIKQEKKNRIREQLILSLKDVEVRKIYQAFIESGVANEKIPNYIVNLIFEDGYGKYDTFKKLVESEDLNQIIKENINNLNYDIHAYSMDRYIGIIDNYNVSNTELKLREYQEFAVDGIDRIFENKRFAGVVLPTGAGKSFVAMAELMKFQKQNIVYFAPQQEILNQFQKHILKHILNKSVLTKDDVDLMLEMTFDQRKEFLRNKIYNPSVNIEDLIKKIQKENFNEKQKDYIIKSMLPRKTEKYDDVKEAIKLVFPHLEMYCYQSLGGNEYQNLLNKKADLFVFDELHRTGAQTWQPRIKKLLNKNESAKILGITATPIRDDFEHVDMMKFMAENYGNYTQQEIINKDYLAEEMYLIDAMQNQYVIEPKIVSFSLTLKETDEYKFIEDRLKKEEKSNPTSDIARELRAIKNEMDSIINGNENNKITNSMDAIGEVIKSNMPVELNNGRFIVFLPTRPNEYDGTSEEYMQNQIEIINQSLKSINSNINSGYLLSNRLDKKQNELDMQSFEESDDNSLNLLYAINMLNEGVHVDNINGEIMLRPIGSGSNILYFQQIGRVIFSIDPNKPIDSDKVPIIFDVYNNYLTRDLDKVSNITTSTSDLNNIQIIKNWIQKHERNPDINSPNLDEARKAITLKKLQRKYEQYSYGIKNQNLSETEKKEIEKIIEIAKYLNLFEIDIPDRIVPPGEKEIGRVNLFEVKGEIKQFLDLFKKAKKSINKSDSKENSNLANKLRIRNVMSILQILTEYGFECSDENLQHIYQKKHPDASIRKTLENIDLLSVIKNSFSKRTMYSVIQELDMDEDELREYKLGKEFDFARSAFEGDDLELKRLFSMYDIKDIRKCGLLKIQGRYIHAVKNGFVVDGGPAIFKKINIYTGTKYDTDGYNIEGYDIFGYDKEGYDKEGYDKNDFKKGESVNRYGFYATKLHKVTGTHLDENFFDFEGNYWKPNPDYPNDVSKRINTYEKVNEKFFNRKNEYCIKLENGEWVKKFTYHFFDRDGFYWKPDPNYPDDVSKRINTHEKINDDRFDVNGFFYIKDENGVWINTGDEYNNRGFDINHLYHKLTPSGKSRFRAPAGKYDDDGYDFYEINKRGFNKNHMYVNDNGELSFLNPLGVADDGYFYTYDETTGEYIQGERYYDSEGYDIDGLNVELFDRDGLYMHKSRVNSEGFNVEHYYLGEDGRKRKVTKFNPHGFDYKHDFQGIIGRKYDNHNFDFYGYFYRLNSQTNEMEKTSSKINDEHFDRDGYYYYFDEKNNNYVKTRYKTNPYGVDIDGNFYGDEIRDEVYKEEYRKKIMKDIWIESDSLQKEATLLIKEMERLEKIADEKVKELNSISTRKYSKLSISKPKDLWSLFQMITEASNKYEGNAILNQIKEKIKKMQQSIKEINSRIDNYDKMLSKQIDKNNELEEKSKERLKLKATFLSKFDNNGICKKTGLKYDENYFTVNQINILTGTTLDLRGFDFSGFCVKNNLLPYDSNGFLIDGTHYQTGEKYHNGYNAYGLDKDGKNRKGLSNSDIDMAKKYIAAIFNKEDSEALPNLIKEYAKLYRKNSVKSVIYEMRLSIVRASVVYPPIKEEIIGHISDLNKKIQGYTQALNDLQTNVKNNEIKIKMYKSVISRLREKLEYLNLDLGDK